MDFELDGSNRGDLYIVSVRGDVDVYTAPLLDACLQDAIAAGNTELAVDLEKCAYIDSEGIKVLVKIQRALGKRGHLAVCAGSGCVQRVFEISG